MVEVIAPVDTEILISELVSERFLRKTNNGNNEIYVISAVDSPNLMREIGRLREISFRDSGGGTGMSIDIDDYDLGENGFKQLIVWNPEENEVVGGYRFIECKNLHVDKNNHVHTPTAKLFAYSEKFIKEYLPYTIELGRSFVQPAYQPSKNFRKGMYSLDNLWDGLGALIIDYPETRYFFGKVTMYGHFQAYARDLILYFMNLYFPDPDHLVYPHEPLPYKTDLETIENTFSGKNYEQDFKLLTQLVRNENESIPPLFNAYMSLSGTMRTFGTALNASFGEVEETGIIVKLMDIFESKKDRHLISYIKGELPKHLS
ncbi:MAG: hemolysin [Bacteroidetes bacterium HGW-Bacteroidetes-1]|nr:MAG: hemolysin [Bacteroidetes bacterium HGW-Bacteroidetes-1]